MDNDFPGGVWPVMLTPFTNENEVDYPALLALTEWYIEQGARGLFAVTQSSEMFFLSLEERIRIASFVKKQAAGRVPVIASGHISGDMELQKKEVRKLAETGVDAVILVTNRLAGQQEPDEVWITRMKELLKDIPSELRLGLYECPYPYKRILSDSATEWCADSGRFYFLKDTSCDMHSINRKLTICRGSNLKLYNANTTTLLSSLYNGAAGYSGVMANMQCRLYEKLTRDYEKEDMHTLSDILSLCALIERQWYPANAKYYLQQEGLPIEVTCRVQDGAALTETWKEEMRILKKITEKLEKEYLREEKIICLFRNSDGPAEQGIRNTLESLTE